tara:strand:+ start:3857 stop:4627 length:771 start_codon:yes stop_codon:yes gene_type:complete
VARTTILDQINRIAQRGGMAMSNGYAIKFDFGPKQSELKSHIDGILPNADIYEGFCDEASLPPSQAATGQTTGKYLGEGQVSYPHTKMYTDFQLGWMCDANMEPYKFLQAWWSYIFSEVDANGIGYDTGGYFPSRKGLNYEAAMGVNAKVRNRTTRMRFPEAYHATIRVGKVEKGPTGDTSRISMVHVLQDAYPYSVETVPLSFGGSTLVKATGNFYYSKHYVLFNDNSTPTLGLLAQLLDTNNDGNLDLSSSDVA